MNESVLRIIENQDFDLELFSQKRAINLIENPFSSVWTDVYKVDEDLPVSLHLFSCFATTNLRQTVLSGQDWLKHIDSFSPGFVVSSNSTKYEPPCSDGFEFIVAKQYFHSLDEGQILLNQEFVLLLELYRGNDGDYYEVNKSGEKE